jgi:hypothetical protein
MSYLQAVYTGAGGGQAVFQFPEARDGLPQPGARGQGLMYDVTSHNWDLG